MKRTKYDVGDALRERGLRENISRFECGGCGRDASIINPAAIAELVEHCMFDHVCRENIVAVRIDYDYANAWQVALEMGLEAQTELEAEWRKVHAKEAA